MQKAKADKNAAIDRLCLKLKPITNSPFQSLSVVIAKDGAEERLKD